MERDDFCRIAKKAVPLQSLSLSSMGKAKAKYYVVWQGREPGIYGSWNECEAQVRGVSAKYMGFPTREAAEEAYSKSWEQYYQSGTKSAHTPFATQILSTTATATSPHRTTATRPILPALCVDAACSGNPGVMEFQGVIADTRSQVFHRGPYRCGTNNIGEFLAIVLGLAWLKKNNLPWVLYSDSRTAIAWVRQRQCKTKLTWNSKNTELLLAVRAAEKWLHDNTWTTPIYKWDTPAWGEIPADFGRKN